MTDQLLTGDFDEKAYFLHRNVVDVLFRSFRGTRHRDLR